MFETKNTTLYSCFSTAAWCFFRTKNQTILITDEISDKRVECSACVFRYVTAQRNRLFLRRPISFNSSASLPGTPDNISSAAPRPRSQRGRIRTKEPRARHSARTGSCRHTAFPPALRHTGIPSRSGICGRRRGMRRPP